MSARPPATNADRGRDSGAGADGDAGSGTDAGAGGSAGGSGDAASIARGLAALNVDGSQLVEESSGPSAAAAAEMRERNEVLEMLKQPSIEEMLASAGGPRRAPPATGPGAAAVQPHRFWDTQPVPKLGAVPAAVEIESRALEPDKPRSEVRAEPYSLPTGFEWCSIDVMVPQQLKELFTLLSENYVEDTDSMFRFNYSAEFLLWALTIPGYLQDWHVGVRASKSRALVACITGVPASISVHGAAPKKMCEINFLCVHKKLRSKRLAPVLIREVTRRVNLTGVFQATYTAGVVLPRPVASCRYYHRSLEPKKLVEVGFSHLAPRMTMNRVVRLYALPELPSTPGLRPLTPRDIPSACALVNSYLESKFKLRPHFAVDEFAHLFLPRPHVVDAFVVTSPRNAGQSSAAADGAAAGAGAVGGDDEVVTDIVSFFHLPSTVIGNAKHSTLFAAYSFYNVPGAFPLPQLMRDALILAHNAGVDVFNCLDLMDNTAGMLEDLKFGPGDGSLQYYLYNWQCQGIKPGEVGLVML